LVIMWPVMAALSTSESPTLSTVSNCGPGSDSLIQPDSDGCKGHSSRLF
jgi:hypothetical protein